uniref:hypothetical protein n=1 Tax=Leyella stercorea TaxID=363265 RepID=UPI003FF10AD5
MASCHTHAAIVTYIRGYGILPYPRCHHHIHRRVWHPAIPTPPSFTSIGGYGILPYPRCHRHIFTHP